MLTRLRHNFQIPKVGTLACQDFFNTYLKIESFFLWILAMAKRIDDMEEANLKLYSVLKDSKVNEEIREQRATGKKMADVAKSNRQFFFETAIVRHVENYLNYLSSLLLDIFIRRPETLRSSERVEISSVLSFQSIPDLVKAFAERKVENLSYSSIAELCDFFKDRFKVELFSVGEMPTVIEAIETRNISVHNRCFINNRYIQKTETDPAQIGKIKELFTKDLDRFVIVFLRSVKDVDKKARFKLKVSGHRLRIDFGR